LSGIDRVLNKVGFLILEPKRTAGARIQLRAKKGFDLLEVGNRSGSERQWRPIVVERRAIIAISWSSA
jgi:hypothetical protein